MKSLQDALYNWLSIKVVCDARPDDTAAKETVEMFLTILENEHHVSNIGVTKHEEMYLVTFQKNGENGSHRFPIDLIDCMIDSINENPERYKNYQ